MLVLGAAVVTMADSTRVYLQQSDARSAGVSRATLAA